MNHNKWRQYEVVVRSSRVEVPVFVTWLFAKDTEHAERLARMNALSKGWPDEAAGEASITVKELG